jgi:RNA recognition motif-containing protein
MIPQTARMDQQQQSQHFGHHHNHNNHNYNRFNPNNTINNGDIYYISKKDKVIPTSTSKTNLYIRGLDENTTDKDLYELCKKYGEIKSTKAIIDKETMKCKGYGFVDFKSLEDAQHALNELKREQRDAQLAKQREQDPNNVYFANLPADVDEAMLNTLLETKFSAQVVSTR